jgi:predicted AAA+ superfamily ATPase
MASHLFNPLIRRLIITKKVLSRITQFTQTTFILGMRGTGKTSLLQN